MDLGSKIRARLDELGMGVTELAGEMDLAGASVTRQAIHRWLNGERQPDPTNLVALVQVLKVPPADRRAWVDAAGYGEVAGVLLGAGAS